MTTQNKTEKVNFEGTTCKEQSQESHSSLLQDSSRDQSQEEQDDQDRTCRKEHRKNKTQSTIVHDNVTGSSIKKSSSKKHKRMNSVHYETLKYMMFELRQCGFKEQYEYLFHRMVTFIEANGVPPRQFVVPCKWNSR